MPVDGLVHNGIGGDMAGLYSPNDPIFLHSVNIDRIWATWQQLGANAAAYGRANADGSVARSTDAIPVYSGLTVSQLLSTASLGYSYQ